MRNLIALTCADDVCDLQRVVVRNADIVRLEQVEEDVENR